MKSVLNAPFILTFLMLVITISNQVIGQCGMVAIPMETQVKASDLVIEGEVTGQRTIVSDDQQNIYTAYKIRVTRIFKGELDAGEIEIVEIGGSTPEMYVNVEPSIKLRAGQTGTFILAEIRSAKMRALRFDVPAFEGYATMQSVFTYNTDRTEVNGVFEKQNFSKWYTSLTTATGHGCKQISELTPLPHVNRSAVTPNITSITPLTTTAGTYSYFNIWGEGFGATPGYVYFKNPDDGGATWSQVTPVHIQSWTENLIVLLVPTNAGSGQVLVTVNGQTAISNESVTITYNHLNQEIVYQNVTWLLHAVNRRNQASGEFQFQFNNNFTNNTDAKRSFIRAFDNWRCNADINYKLGPVTTVAVHALEGTSVITFDTNDPLPPGVAGRTHMAGPGCFDINYPATPVSDIDILFASNPPEGWNFGYNYPEQLDFESVALHELGHALQLRHVLQPDHVMWPFILPAEARRDLHPNDILGAIAARDKAETYPAYCNYSPLTEYVANHYVDLTTTNTVQNGDSWSTAIPYLQDALMIPFNNACFDTLFVAAGVHLPDEGWFQNDNNSSFATFDLTKPLIMMGGYPAGGGTRNIEMHQTILSGDVDEDNLHDADNSCNVVVVNANVIVDGFTIEHGFADANNGARSVGAGLTNNVNSTLRNMIFRKNKSRGSIANPNGKGGAIYNAAGNLTVVNALFYQNEATQYGNAISVAAGLFHGTNCTFINNGPTVSTLHFIAGANVLRNSITWHNNTGNDFQVTSPATLQLLHMLIEETAIPAGVTAFDTYLGRDPLFVDEAVQNYRLQYCSPGMNTGFNLYNSHPFDVAGNPRTQGVIIDRGAYESTFTSPPTQVTTTADGGAGSLRTIVNNACEYMTVSFSSSLNGNPVQLTSGPISLNKELTILGQGVNNTSISAGGNNHHFELAAGKYYTFINIALTGGASQSGFGNCIKNYGHLFLNNVKLQSQPGAPQPYTLANYPSSILRTFGTVTIQ